MNLRFLFNLVAVLILAVIQVSFLSTWPYPVNFLNLILVLVIFLTVIVNYRLGLWWAFGGGLLMDLFSLTVFGLISFSMIFTAIIINFLFKNFFTNRSLYSLLLLGFFGIFFYNFLLFLISFIFGFLGIGPAFIFDYSYLYNFLWQLILNIIMIFVIFFVFDFSSAKLHNSFLTAP